MVSSSGRVHIEASKLLLHRGVERSGNSLNSWLRSLIAWPATWSRFGAVACALFAVGAGLRLWLVMDAPPAFIGYPDSGGYMSVAAGRLFANEFQPPGYPLFLRAMHLLSARLVVTVLIQHMLGLLTAGLYLACVRRVAGVAWVALIPAALILFDGAGLFFEHAVMSDTLLVAVVAVAMFAAVRTSGRRWLPWTIVMGAAVGVAVEVRVVAVALIPVLGVWLALTHRGAARRFLPAALFVAVACATVGSYVVANHAQNGVWGLTGADGFNPYIRVESFADCSRWRPPNGTRILCARSIPPVQFRTPSPFVWACPIAPGLCRFGNPPGAAAKMSAFARAAVWHQPWDYVAAVARDAFRFVAPPPGYSQGDLLRLLQNPLWERQNVAAMARYYSERSAPAAIAAAPVAYGLAVHTTGAVIGLLVIGALIAMPLCRGRERAAAALFAVTGLVLLLASVAAATYQPRYAIPALAPLASATALGISGGAVRLRRGER